MLSPSNRLAPRPGQSVRAPADRLVALFLFVVLPLVGSGGRTLAAQQEEPPRKEEPRGSFEDSVDVVEILVDVSVTDRRGNAILGLEADDFVVTHRGEPLEVTSVTLYSSHPRSDLPGHAARLGLAPQGEPANRYFILFFHDLMRPDYETLGVTAQQSMASAMARMWVEDELLPSDYVAVASFDFKLKIHEDFSRDRESLERALKRTVLRRDPERDAQRKVPDVGPSLLRHLPRGRELRDETRNIREALWTLAQGLRPLDGRKNLVLFSIGAGLVEELAPVLNRSNVDVYTVDISPPMAEHMQAVALQGLARDTDGHFFRWGSYFDSLRRLSRRTQGYYQLAVLVEKEPDGSLPKSIDVDVRYDNFRVQARRRYVEGDPDLEDERRLEATRERPPRM